MAEAPGAATAASAASVVDNELSLAENLQKTAIWIAGVLGAVPVLTTIGALIQGAGDNGFDSDRLARGLVFAVIGFVVGLGGSAYIRAPFGTRLDDIGDDDVKRVPGSPYETKAKLVLATDRARNAIRDLELAAAIAGVEAKRQTAKASRLAEDLKQMREQEPQATIASLGAAASMHATAATEAEDAERHAGRYKADLDRWTTQLERRNFLLGQAFRMHNAVAAKERLAIAGAAWVVATAAIGASLYFLATAPIINAAPSPELVSLTLSPTGRTQLECNVETLQGLRLGGTDEAPKIVTFPQADCPSRSVTFVVAPPTPWGTVETIEPIEAPG